MAALAKLRQDSPDVVSACDVAAGLSLGEYTALCFADAISFDDAVRLVRWSARVLVAHQLQSNRCLE